MESRSPECPAPKIDSAIDKLIEDFKKYPDIFLTEEDMRSRLYSYLLEGFNNIEKSRYGALSIPIHTEVRWYGSGDEKLKFRSDIVVIDPFSLNTDKRYVLSKGYSFADAIAVIELKLRRVKYSPDNRRFGQMIDEDLKKLKKIRDRAYLRAEMYLVTFDKKENLGISNFSKEPFHLFYVFNNKSCGDERVDKTLKYL